VPSAPFSLSLSLSSHQPVQNIPCVDDCRTFFSPFPHPLHLTAFSQMAEHRARSPTPPVTKEEIAKHLDIAISNEQDFLVLFESGPLRRLVEAPWDLQKPILSFLSARRVQRVLLELAFVVPRVEHNGALNALEHEIQQLKRNMLHSFQPHDLNDVEVWTQWKKEEKAAERKPVDLLDLTIMTPVSRAEVGKAELSFRRPTIFHLKTSRKHLKTTRRKNQKWFTREPYALGPSAAIISPISKNLGSRSTMVAYFSRQAKPMSSLLATASFSR
jgi:hypothetical protein